METIIDRYFNTFKNVLLNKMKEGYARDRARLKKMGKEEEIVDHLVDYANDGQEAIDMYKKSGIKGQPYCLIIIDYSMPKMDGYEATKLIREACRE